MKKKIFAMLMAAALCLGMIPSTVLADVEEQTGTEQAVEMGMSSEAETGDEEIADLSYETIEPAAETECSDCDAETGTGDEDPDWEEYSEMTTIGDDIETVGEEEQAEELFLIYEGLDYKVTVVCGSYAGLPDDVSLSVSEYLKDSGTYLARLQEAKEICGLADEEENAEEGEFDARLFDISLMANGEEVEPAASVTVSISYPGQEKEKDYSIVHFGEETEKLQAEVELNDEVQTMTFDLDSFSDIMVLAYDGPVYDIVFTTSNDNGLATNYSGSGTLYSGGYNGGNRTVVSGSALSDYADAEGMITVTLPSDGDLGSEFAVYTDGVTGNSATVALSNIDSHYDYELAGWYNLGTGDYIDVSGGSATTEIDLKERNVFYADYYAADYNVGYDNGNLAGSVSTDFVNIELFDYNELFNLYSTNVTSGTNNTGEVFTDSGNFYTDPAVLDDNNAGHAGSATGISSFITKYNYIGRSNSNDTSYQANIFYPGNLRDWNEWVGSYNLKDAGAIWGINSSNYEDNALLNKLFNPDSGSTLGVKYIGSADYLFQYGTEENGAPEEYIGYYYYSSNLNSAAYNQSDGRFYVYNDVEAYSDSNMFLPFQDHDEYMRNGAGTDDLNINYLFGMSMEVDFYLPNAVNGETAGDGVGNVDVNGDDLIFSYSGDDDILIFIDDTLVLDMSGIHLAADGSINFNTGTWEMSNVTSGPSGNINLGAGSHRLTVYYLERGTGYSNLTVSFNVVPMWHYEAADVQTIEAAKVWVDADHNVIEDTSDLPDVNVGLFAALGENEMQADGSYQYTDDKNQVHVFTCTEQSYTHSIDGGIVESSTEKNDDGQFVDEKGWVLAWIEDDALYVRVDVQILGESNGWTHVWEMRSPEESYVVLEMEEKGYTLVDTETRDDITHYYWSIIGESEIEDHIANADLSQVKLILTDGAQHKTSADTLGDTLEAAGWVLVADPDGTITAKSVTFSQIGTLVHVNPETGEEIADWYGTYGVTTESEINQYGDGAVWYLEDADDIQDDTTGEKIEGFYLYCVMDETIYYMNVPESMRTLSVTADRDSANEFYYDSLGELRVVSPTEDDGRGNDVPTIAYTRIEITSDGQITLEAASESADSNDVRIYTLTEIAQNGHGYTFTNLLPENPVKSVDVGDGTAVAVGDGLVYTVSYYNHYGVPTDVTITDVLDAGLDFVSATDGGTYDESTRTITWILEDAAAYTWGTVSFTAIVNDNALLEGIIPNTADVQIGNDSAVTTNKVQNPVEEVPDDQNPGTEDPNGPNPDDNNPDNQLGSNPNGGGSGQGGTNGSSPTTAKRAKTGDSGSIYLWIVLIIAAAVVAMIAVIARKRRPRIDK